MLIHNPRNHNEMSEYFLIFCCNYIFLQLLKITVGIPGGIWSLGEAPGSHDLSPEHFSPISVELNGTVLEVCSLLPPATLPHVCSLRPPVTPQLSPLFEFGVYFWENLLTKKALFRFWKHCIVHLVIDGREWDYLLDVLKLLAIWTRNKTQFVSKFCLQSNSENTGDPGVAVLCKQLDLN
ncbi:hypothetical protein NE237_005707 [Protea cynaroides]|uniref:Uncharacterized protein n=1 Tax=Protea cynaroides TaxID=273540 RepID=A0A9Q0KKX9_9MAGN|nr:hypothetical protein NE237_005707 [Protea cynaroides]